MSLPVATTTVSVFAPHAEAVDQWSAGYDDDEATEPGDEPTARATGVRAVISAGAARGSSGNAGEVEDVTFSMVCDPTSLDYRDIIRDDVTGLEYRVEWVVETPGVADLGHMQVGLSTHQGGRA